VIFVGLRKTLGWEHPTSSNISQHHPQLRRLAMAGNAQVNQQQINLTLSQDIVRKFAEWVSAAHIRNVIRK